MGIREGLNKKSGTAATAAGAVLFAAILLIIVQARGNHPTRISKAFYSTDDGKTWFTDDDGKLFPFDHDGQQAFRVDVYKTSGGTEFVGDIERYTDSSKAKLEELRAQPNPDSRTIAAVSDAGLQIKRPGDTRWYSLHSPQGTDIMAVSAPDGSPVVGVTP
jgi:hypothetical protein